MRACWTTLCMTGRSAKLDSQVNTGDPTFLSLVPSPESSLGVHSWYVISNQIIWDDVHPASELGPTKSTVTAYVSWNTSITTNNGEELGKTTCSKHLPDTGCDIPSPHGLAKDFEPRLHLSHNYVSCSNNIILFLYLGYDIIILTNYVEWLITGGYESSSLIYAC